MTTERRPDRATSADVATGSDAAHPSRRSFLQTALAGGALAGTAYVALGRDMSAFAQAGGPIVIGQHCELTGGFAFCVWLPPTDPTVTNRAGDFVLTLGGQLADDRRFVQHPPGHGSRSKPGFPGRNRLCARGACPPQPVFRWWRPTAWSFVARNRWPGPSCHLGSAQRSFRP